MGEYDFKTEGRWEKDGVKHQGERRTCTICGSVVSESHVACCMNNMVHGWMRGKHPCKPVGAS